MSQFSRRSVIDDSFVGKLNAYELLDYEWFIY